MTMTLSLVSRIPCSEDSQNCKWLSVQFQLQDDDVDDGYNVDDDDDDDIVEMETHGSLL